MEHSISVNVAGRDVTLLFGMTAIRIWQERTTNDLLAVNNDPKKVDQVKTFASCIFAGMCNMSDYKELPHPEYSECYEIAESILFEDENIQTKIWDCFTGSRAYERMIKKLNDLTGKQKKSEGEKTTSRRGSKSK